MTTFVLTPARTWSPATTGPNSANTPQFMLEAHTLRAYTLRANGTMRHLDLAPVGSTRRDTAEYVSERLDEVSVQAVARELHVSVATVRRYLLSLEITEAIEAGEWDDLSFDTAGEPVWADGGDAEVTTEELATDCGWDRCAMHGSGNDIAASEPCPGPGADLALLDHLADSLELNR